MSKTKTIRANFSDKHKEYIKKAVEVTLSVAEGSVRAGKTVDNVFAFAYLIDNGVPDKFHLATGSTAANAKLKNKNLILSIVLIIFKPQK